MKLDDVAIERQENTSVCLAFKNPVFIQLSIASLVSGCFVAAHDMAATWLMNSLGAELVSAITLSGAQMNLAGIVGPALGGFLLPIVGPSDAFFSQRSGLFGRGVDH